MVLMALPGSTVMSKGPMPRQMAVMISTILRAYTSESFGTGMQCII